MSPHPLDQFDVPTRILKRAQYEAFEFELLGTDVRVRNASHAEPSEHENVVTIDAGLPMACTCPADIRFEYACKHRIAIRRPVLRVATEAKRVAKSTSKPVGPCV